MVWTKENNPHTQGTAPQIVKGAKKKKEKKVAPMYSGRHGNAFYWKGIKQVGDAALYGGNPEAYYTQYHIPATVVGPGDIVDDLYPAKLYTFYLLHPGGTDDTARELDRLRRAGWFKCEVPRFISPTGKFETRDGVLVLGLGIWYALPMARKIANREAARKDMGPQTVAEAHADLAARARAEGMSAEAQTRADSRGQRLK